jgi:transposase
MAAMPPSPRTVILNRLGTSVAKRLIPELKRQLKAVEIAIANLDIEIKRLIAGDPVLALSPKQAAMIAGLVPIARGSGEHNGARHIRGVRAHVRKALYMAAVSAASFNPALKLFYSRLIAVSKKPKVALTAVMRKLVVFANTLLREDRPWRPNHP